MDKKDSIISAEKIFKVIYNFEGKSNTLGKTVTIFIGVSQSGKTTTINALRGAKYQIKEDETIIITNKSFNNAGITGGRDGASCTIFPLKCIVFHLFYLMQFVQRFCHDLRCI